MEEKKQQGDQLKKRVKEAQERMMNLQKIIQQKQNNLRNTERVFESQQSEEMSQLLKLTNPFKNDNQIEFKSIAKKPCSTQELNGYNTSDTGSSSESPNNSCYSQGHVAKSLFNIEDYIESAKKSSTLATIKKINSSALALNKTSSQNTSSTTIKKQHSDDSTQSNPNSSQLAKKTLARKSEFLEDELFCKVEKRVKGNESLTNFQIHEVISFASNDGSKEFNFNCFPERFLGIPSEFHDKNIHHNSDNDAESSDETIVSACRYNLRKIKLELMDINTSFRYSHHHVDLDKVTAQYTSPKKRSVSTPTASSIRNE